MSGLLLDYPSDNDDDFVAAAAVAVVVFKRRRRPSHVPTRLDWIAHVKRLLKEGQFQHMYRMSHISFCKLLHLLLSYLKVNQHQGCRHRCGMCYISPELILHCLIRYMAGGSHHDIHVLFGLPKSSFFYCLHRAIDAINICPELDITFPMDSAGLKRLALGFTGKSSFGVIDGCVGELDGWLCRIKVPLGKDTSNISSYFSGHYQCYGVNVQAVCNSMCRFTYMSCRSPGGTGDSRAFHGTALSYFLHEIPQGFYLLGDSAYTLSSSLLVPYTGAD